MQLHNDYSDNNNNSSSYNTAATTTKCVPLRIFEQREIKRKRKRKKTYTTHLLTTRQGGSKGTLPPKNERGRGRVSFGTHPFYTYVRNWCV